MRSFVLLVLLTVTAVGNTENENLIHELKSLISKKSGEAKRYPNAVNVQEKGDTYSIREAEACYDYSYLYSGGNLYSSFDGNSFSYYDSGWDRNNGRDLGWFYDEYSPSYYDEYSSSYYDEYSSSYYDRDWNIGRDLDWYYDEYPSSYYDEYSSSYYDWDWSSYYDWDWSSYYDGDSNWYDLYNYFYLSLFDPEGSLSSDGDWNYPSEMFYDYDCGYNVWYKRNYETCVLEEACGRNMWYGVKRGAKRVEEKTAQERINMIRSLEATDKGKIMVGRSAGPNPAEKSNRNKRIARKGHQNRALNPQHTRNMATHKRDQHGENVAKNKMAAMRARHEIPANRRMHVRNKMAGKENNDNERKIARRKLSGEKKMEARNRFAASRHMAEQAKLEARKKMAGNENIEEKENKAGGMGTMNKANNLLERLKARQLKALERKSGEAVDTAKEAEKNGLKASLQAQHAKTD